MIQMNALKVQGHCGVNCAGNRLQSRGLESPTAGLQSLRLASWLKLWLRTIDGLGWLLADGG